MTPLDALACLLAAASTVEAAHEYCGECGCFNDAEYALLLGMSTSTPAPSAAVLPLFETVTADGIVFTIGSDRAIVDGTEYSIGAGASLVTIYLDTELFAFGPRGVEAPTTTFAPYFPAMAWTTGPTTALGGPPAQTTPVGGGGTVVANGTATILVPDPASPTGSIGIPTLHTTPTSTSSMLTPQSIPVADSSSLSTTISFAISETTSSTAAVPPSSNTPSAASTDTSSTDITTTTTTTTTSSTPLPPVQTTNLNSVFINTILTYTNMYRAINQAPPISWDPVKALYAQNWANQCNFVHSKGPYGENLAIGGYSNPALYVWYWYDEINEYTSYVNPNLTEFTNWGHFTQLVWKNTASIGCGYATDCATSAYGQYYLVCEYDTGNVVPASNFVANVLTPTQAEPAAPTGDDSSYE